MLAACKTLGMPSKRVNAAIAILVPIGISRASPDLKARVMNAAPSVTYASARNPVAAIKTAILRTIEERSDNPRKVWAALCASARVELNSSLTTEQFTKALKYTGTGIQLTPGDTELVLGADPLTFARFQAFVAENPSW